MFAAPALAQNPQPEKIDQLIQLLSDPAVKTWLETQAKPQAAPPEADSASGSLLSAELTMIRHHVQALADALPTLPAQFARAWLILMFEFEGAGLLGIVSLIAGLVVAGLGLDRLARWALGNYRQWMIALPTAAPQGRVKSLAARLLFALITISAFTAGTAGVFVIFQWPPLLQEILLSYLAVAIIVRVVMMLIRALLLPPQILAPASRPKALSLRALPVSDGSVTHWYRWLPIIVGWVAFCVATLALLGTFGVDAPGRALLDIPCSFVTLALVVYSVWRRPKAEPAPGSKPRMISTHAATWLTTLLAVALWFMWVGHAWTLFWALLAVVALPLAIITARKSVHYILRAPDTEADGAPIAPVTVAVIDRGIRVILIVIAAFALARMWGFDLATFSENNSSATALLRGALKAVVILLVADFGWTIVKAVIARKLLDGSSPEDRGHIQDQARLRTLLPIFQNILFAVIMSMALLMVLSSLGIEIGPLIAGAGVVGVAIGFGAQTLVKDIISGMFYLLDDAFRVGEYIESGSYKGSVESFSLRSIKLRHHRGYLFTVPFGMLGAIQNMSRDWVIEKFNITVGYDTDIDKARKIIKKIGLELAADPEYAPHVIEPLKMQGVQEFGDYGITIRMKMMTKPGEQFPMKRRAHVLIKAAFKENGISIPTPTVHVTSDRPEAAAGAAARMVTTPADAAQV